MACCTPGTTPGISIGPCSKSDADAECGNRRWEANFLASIPAVSREGDGCSYHDRADTASLQCSLFNQTISFVLAVNQLHLCSNTGAARIVFASNEQLRAIEFISRTTSGSATGLSMVPSRCRGSLGPSQTASPPINHLETHNNHSIIASVDFSHFEV